MCNMLLAVVEHGMLRGRRIQSRGSISALCDHAKVNRLVTLHSEVAMALLCQTRSGFDAGAVQ